MVGITDVRLTGGVADEIAQWDEADYVVITAGRFDCSSRSSASTGAHLLDVTNRIRALRRRPLDRELPLPRALEAAVRLGCPDDEVDCDGKEQLMRRRTLDGAPVARPTASNRATRA